MYQYNLVKTRGKDKSPRKRPFKTNRTLTISSIGNLKQTTPFIRLSGLWLNDFGFHEGDKISVQCENGKLTITKLEDQ